MGVTKTHRLRPLELLAQDIGKSGEHMGYIDQIEWLLAILDIVTDCQDYRAIVRRILTALPAFELDGAEGHWRSLWLKKR